MNRNKGKAPPRYKHRVDQYKSLWNKWNGIKKRCLFETDERYHDYGGRGIKMCQPWIESFDNFAEWALANGYKDGLTIERIDVNGDYCPENCKWIPLREQRFNTRKTIWVDYKGRHIQLIKLCCELNKNYDTVHNRITKMGWNAEKAIDEPSEREKESLRHKCAERKINYWTVRARICKLGWSEEKALSIPAGIGDADILSSEDKKRKCKYCGNGFFVKKLSQLYCSAECQKNAQRQRIKKLYQKN